MPNLVAFIIGLFVIATILRVDFFFYLLYLFFGILFFSRIWTDRALRKVQFARRYDTRAFPGERVNVEMEVVNDGLWPLPWLRLHESLPLQLRSPNFYHCVLSLLPYERRTISYELDCRRRGYYPLGPLVISTGDLFGTRQQEQRLTTDDALTVYPRVVPLKELGLPAQTPFGSIATRERIYEDPTRIIGTREYHSGDSLRHIHWTATAATGQLQVKNFEPAISIDAQIVLNLNRDDYTISRAPIASELAIVTAASIASHLIGKRQTVGLSSNGNDPLMSEESSLVLPPHKGQDHLMHLLEVLARTEMSRERPFGDLLRRTVPRLSWGSTVIIITPDADDVLYESLLLMKRSGFRIVLVVTDPQNTFRVTEERAAQVGIKAYQVWQERDLDVWRQ